MTPSLVPLLMRSHRLEVGVLAAHGRVRRSLMPEMPKSACRAASACRSRFPAGRPLVALAIIGLVLGHAGCAGKVSAAAPSASLDGGPGSGSCAVASQDTGCFPLYTDAGSVSLTQACNDGTDASDCCALDAANGRPCPTPGTCLTGCSPLNGWRSQASCSSSGFWSIGMALVPCANANGSPVGCWLADSDSSFAPYGCDFGLACALTDGGQLTCVGESFATHPCNGGWCGSGCTCIGIPGHGPSCLCGAAHDAGIDTTQ
jgi:hypothetical protein